MKPRPAITFNASHPSAPDVSLIANEGSGTTTLGYSDPTITGSFQGTVAPAWGVDESGRYLRMDGAASAASRVRYASTSALNVLRAGDVGGPSAGAEACTIQVVFDYVGTAPGGATQLIIARKEGQYSIGLQNTQISVMYWRTGVNNPRWWIISNLAANARQNIILTVSGNDLSQICYQGAISNLSQIDLGSQGNYSGSNPLSVGARDDGANGTPILFRAFNLWRSRVLTAAELKLATYDPFFFANRVTKTYSVPFAASCRWPTSHNNTLISAGGGAGNILQGRINLFEVAEPQTVHVGAGGAETDALASQVIKQGFEVDEVVQTTWSSQTTTTVAPGAYVTSDIHQRAGGRMLALPERLICKQRQLITASAGIPADGYATGPYYFNDFSALNTAASIVGAGLITSSVATADGHTLTASDLTLSGSIPQTNVGTPGVFFMIGKRTTNLNTPIFWGIGDSIGNGQGSSLGNTLGGYVGMACTMERVPHVMINVPSSTIANFVADSAVRVAAMALFDASIPFVVYWQFSINDFGASRTAAQVGADYLAAIALVNAAHANTTHVFCATTPATTATSDTYHTVSGQTVATYATEIQTFNAAVRDNPRIYGFHRIVEAGTAMASSPFASSWAVDGSTNNYPTTDGIHPAQVMYTRAMQAVRQDIRDEMQLRCTPSATATATTVSLAANGFGGECWNDFAWTCTSKPAGSTATFNNATAESPVVTVDTFGDYTFSLTISDPAGATYMNTVTVKVPPPDAAIIEAVGGDYVTPTAPQIIQGVTVGAGAYQLAGTYVRPTSSQLPTGVTVGAGAYSVSGNRIDPAEASVSLDVGYGANGTEFVGEAALTVESIAQYLAGAGARTITITVNDGVTALQNARVRIYQGSVSLVQTTNSSGVVTFNADDATYTVAITLAGYSYAGTTLVVDGNETVTYSMSVSAGAATAVTPGLAN